MRTVLKRLVMTALVAVTLSACGTVVAPTPGAETAPEATAEQTQEEASEPESELIDPNDLEVGDCWNPMAFDVSSNRAVAPGVEVVPCETAHAGEVYAIFEIELNGEFPDEAVIYREFERGCMAGFEDFVGSSYESSLLGMYGFTPSEKSWTVEHDRTVICSIIDMYGEPLTGSMEGSER